MCFDIEVTKLTLAELYDTLRRINLVLSKPFIVNNLPDKGHQLRIAKEKLQKEIEFRESLETTRQMMKKLSIKCSSENNIGDHSHASRLCAIEKKPERLRFKPHLTLKAPASGKSESMCELHSGTKLIDLTTSLSLLQQQQERVSVGQLRARQERMEALTKPTTSKAASDDSDTDFNDPQPGPSGYKSKVQPDLLEKENADSSEVKVESTQLEEPKEDSSPPADVSDVTSESKPKKAREDFEEPKTEE